MNEQTYGYSHQFIPEQNCVHNIQIFLCRMVHTMQYSFLLRLRGCNKERRNSLIWKYFSKQSPEKISNLVNNAGVQRLQRIMSSGELGRSEGIFQFTFMHLFVCTILWTNLRYDFLELRKIHWVTNIPKYSLDHSTNVDNRFRFRKAMITFAFFITNIELFCLHCKWLGWLFHQNDKEYKKNSMKLMVKKMKNKN